MFFFLKNITIFSVLFLFNVLVIFFIVNNLSDIDYHLYNEHFIKKVEKFEKANLNKKQVKLIIGSSHMVNSIDEDLLESDWYKFANGGQNIYESYKFLDYYIEKIKIDSIVISIHPFDFPFSYTKNRSSWLPVTNGNFCYFGHDSITSISYKRKLQEHKDNIYQFEFQKNKYPEKTTHSNLERYKFDIPNQSLEETKFIVGNDKVTHHYQWFYNVKDEPNMKYFDILHSLIKKKDITLICILTPKSTYYRNGLIIEGNQKKWNNIIDSLKVRNVKLWDFEALYSKKVPLNTFANEDHLTKDGAKHFTKFFVEKLKNSKKYNFISY